MEPDHRTIPSNQVAGPVRGHAVQVGIVHGGVHIVGAENGRSADEEITSLLRAQVRAAQDLPRLLPGARRPALADVYVRQHLGGDVADPRPEPPQPTPILDGHGQFVEVPAAPVVRVAVRPPVRTAWEALDGTDHLIVTGGAGQGKSTLSLRLAADVATRFLDGDGGPLSEPVVPLRLTARELAARLDLPFPEALADSARADYGALLRVPVSADVLGRRVAGHRWLLLVDGLDEVADANDRDRLVKVLAAGAAEPVHRVVLTTRPIEGVVLAPLHRVGAVRYQLQAFDDATLRRFAENWFADDGPGPAERFLRQIKTAHLEELVRVPLLATIAAIVFRQRSDLPLPDNQYELYEAYFSFLRSTRPADSPFEPHRARLLEHLGLVRVESDTSPLSAARDWVRRHVPPEHLPPDWSEHLTDFLVGVGPLVIRGDDLTFLHHSFAEHLAATAAAGELPADFAADHPDFARLLHAARPEERGRYARAVALHYTHLRPDQADPLLRSLHAGGAEQHLLAARLLAKRLPASPAAVDEFLDTVRGWAATTHHLAGEILSHACRATQHPGLSPWLVRLMRDGTAPWPSRTAAAAALAVRLRDGHLAEAVGFLRALVDDAHAAVEVRLAAAEALADTGAAERDAAARGLRSVLDDPLRSDTGHRAAAVILSAFGDEARDVAVTAMTRLLDDRDTPPAVVVEAATALIEIDTEFHPRAAEAFRVVLHDRVHDETAREDAALGMASLGPEHTDEAVAALTAVVGDRRRSRAHRVSAAEVLGRLNQQHRQAAGDAVRAMPAEPDTTAYDTRYCAARLAAFGPAARDEAERLLRTVITDPGTPVDDVLWALHALGELGAEHLPEVARRSWELLAEVRPGVVAHATLLGHLAAMGEPHRSAAVERLLAHLADGTADPAGRCRAAAELIGAGPEFHADVARHLRSIADSGGAPIEAWRELVKLGPQYQPRALRALHDAIARTNAGPVVWYGSVDSFWSTPAERDGLADALMTALTDRERSYHERLSALNSLVTMGFRYHHRAVGALCELLREVRTQHFDFRYVAGMIAELGVGLRERVARVLCDLLTDPRANPRRRDAVLEGLEVLGFLHLPEARAALHAVIANTTLSSFRLNAQGMLVAVDPTTAPDIADDVFAPEGDLPPSTWIRLVDQLSLHGVDVADRLRRLVGNIDVDRRVRWYGAVYGYESFPAVRAEAAAEIARQLDSAHMRPTILAGALYNAVRVAALTSQEAVDRLEAQVGDERLNIGERAESATSLVWLDRAAAPKVLALLTRLADDPGARPVDRARAVRSMVDLGSHYVVPHPRLVAGAAQDATADDLRTSLVRALPRDLRTNVERAVLDDRVLPPRERVPQPDIWDDMPLALDAAAALREVLAGPEFRHGELLQAAFKLTYLDIRTVPGVVAQLAAVPADGPSAGPATLGLIMLGGEREWQRWERTALDPGLPPRVRWSAAHLLLTVASRTPPALAGMLREVATDPRTPMRRRALALLALGRFDGLTRLRAVRDDPRTTSATRWAVARDLLDYDAADLAAAAAVMAGIAGDPAERPALRTRAAYSLAYRGVEGRDRAVELLGAMARDVRLPVGARADAASWLGEHAPSLRGEALALLRGMRSVERPLTRRKVLLAIGELRPEEAAVELLAMARDVRHGVVARVRCAEGAVRLWRGCRDEAAVVVRGVALDVGVARHVRRTAARHLARWSAVCRDEARAVLRALDPGVTR
ncbi:NACHT domain-containing protein [Saccharothrix obliqua]|uniref:NACHT domain-containing protein n=1 Tax=Saccharothrix obliqua TaxID=2861747 RepID=UPI001C5CCE52|nr:NACHT domain-containing protein [Saccharothrix obliqua]MBW4720469.1 NACHT domain-containing protein [Saccharothrix obliqua]